MDTIYTGTSIFAVPSLEALIASQHDILAVITQPDKPKGRGHQMQISPVKGVALAHGIPIMQPEKISARESVDEIKELGPIGAMVAQWLKLKGCSRVYVADVDAAKLEIAAALGMHPIDSRQLDLVEEIKRLESSLGVDCCVEAVGLPATFLQAIQCTGRFGQVVFMGNINGTFSIPQKEFSRILRNEMTIQGTWNSKIVPRGKDEWTRVLDFLDVRLQVKPLISHTPPLAEGAAVFYRMVARAEWFNKVVFSI